MEPVRWGIISTARIGLDLVIPAMQQSDSCDVVAIGSRNLEAAQKAASKLAIPKAYGSYEELLADPDIEAVYNPLPNHLHVPWSIKAAEAGKHVLCEKPLSMDAAEAQTLLDARNRTGVLMQEAFMVRSHPQWVRAREVVRSGRIGELRAVQGFFSYYNTDPTNIRNMADIGGGGIYDIGCYPTVGSRFVFEDEPTRVVALIEYDPVMKTDRLASAILDFPGGQASWVCSTQLSPYQRMQIVGTKGRVEIEIPFNAPSDRSCRLWVDDGSGGHNTTGAVLEEIDTCNQYEIQGRLFSEAVRGITPIEFPLENAVANMKIIDALFRSGEEGGWVNL